MGKLKKLPLLLGLLPRNPEEFYDRVANVLEVYWERLWLEPGQYAPCGAEEAWGRLESLLGMPATKFLKDPSLKHMEARIREQIQWLHTDQPFTLAHNADVLLARFCYVTCRVLRPRLVLETGVGYGVTSSYILQALAQNDTGVLWSLDLPPLARTANSYTGIFIPAEHKCRWNFRRGVTKRLLPRFLPRLGTVDVFIHDSLHTCRNMRWELETVWPAVRQGGVLIVDDICENSAFAEFVYDHAVSSFAVREEKKHSVFGVIVKNGTGDPPPR